jgi:hypothetical protein
MDKLFRANLWAHGSKASRALSKRFSKSLQRRVTKKMPAALKKNAATWVEIEKRVKRILRRFDLVGRYHVCDGMSFPMSLAVPSSSLSILTYKITGFFVRAKIFQKDSAKNFQLLIRESRRVRILVPSGAVREVNKEVYQSQIKWFERKIDFS